MDKQVLSVKAEEFRDKQTGKETTMYKVYLLADDGSVGYIYSSKAVKPGQTVRVGLAERDGKLKLKLYL